MKEHNTEFGERLQQILKENKISQSELARRLKINQNEISRYCTGKRKPPIDILIDICKELNESSDYLLGLKNY